VRAAEALRALGLAGLLVACGAGAERPALRTEVSCEIVRAPGGMVATVAGATLEVEAERATDAVTTIAVQLRDGGRVVDTAAVEIPPAAEGERARFEIGFPNAPEGGWTTQSDARCVARPGG
jgi:hypothetical protein